MEKKRMIGKKIEFSILAVVLMVSFAALVSSTSLSHAVTGSYNNVQVFVQTATSFPDYFTVSAFNMSGYMVSSCQTQYPAASFELPNGQYIFAVTADQSSDNIYYTPIPAVGTSSSEPALQVYEAPVVEYGYTVQQISGPTTFTVSTQNVTSFPTTTLTIQVFYANGTAAEGASVTASILGSSYYWGYETNTVMWNTTQADGTATLVIPLAPVQIDAWDWIPVDLPNNLTTITLTVGGEPVNVTVYWEPTYVGVAASALIVPPQNSTTMVLHIQQASYWVMPYGVETPPPTTEEPGTASSSTSSIPATVYQQQQGNPILKNYQAPTTTQTTSTTTPTIAPTSDNDKGLFAGSNAPLTIIALASIATAALSLTVAIRTRKRKLNNKS
jgi:hypothetical protein